MATYDGIRELIDTHVDEYIKQYNPVKLSMNIGYFKEGHSDIITDTRGVRYWEANGYKIIGVSIHGYSSNMPTVTIFSLED